MAVIAIRRRTSGTTLDGVLAALHNGELFYHDVNKGLYIKSESGTLDSVGGTGLFMALVGDQNISGNKTFQGDIRFSRTDFSTSGNTTLVNKGYVDAVTSGAPGAEKSVILIGDVTGTGQTGSNITTNIAAGVVGNTELADMAAKSRIKGSDSGSSAVTDLTGAQVRTVIDFDNQVVAKKLNEFATPDGNVAFGSNNLIDVADPTADQHAATKKYVDDQFATAASGLDFKESVVVATTANITLNGGQTIDGEAVVTGDRVLVKDQDTPSQNGIYEANTDGDWTRTPDASEGTLTDGAFVYVETGTDEGGKAYVLTFRLAEGETSIAVGTTEQSWVQFAGSTVPGGFPLQLDKGGTHSDLTLAGTGGVVYKAANQLLVNDIADVANGAILTFNSAGAPVWSNVIDGGIINQ